MLKDVQSESSNIKETINKVGVSELVYPVKILRKDNNFQSTVASIEAAIELPAEVRGTHMSRFTEVIERHKHNINGETVANILKDIETTFKTNKAYMTIIFPYFIEKRAPVTRKSSILKVECGYKVRLEDSNVTSTLYVKVPVTTLCPCSKEISDRGAHNQRAYVQVELTTNQFVWFEDLIDLIEQSASSPVYSLLKREDEKFVTEQAYDNPRFVEDLVRIIYQKIKQNYQFSHVKIRVDSEESIHAHRAFAELEREG